MRTKTRKPQTTPTKTTELPDDLNPEYVFSTTATQLLCRAARGEIDLEQIARDTLAHRGLDHEGKWVGFEAAERIANGFPPSKKPARTRR